MIFRGILFVTICLTAAQPCPNSDTLSPELDSTNRFYDRFEAPTQNNRCRNDRHCVVSGCSSEICAAEALHSTCEQLFSKPQGCCGCNNGECQWLSERDCDIPDDWTVASESPEQCTLIDFTCADGFEHWNSECGCGCRPSDPVDLIVNDLTRAKPYYKIKYCNMGSSATGSDFTLLLTNTNTGSSFQTNYLYPFSIPAPGTCAWTGGITCGLIGDSNCDANICVEGFVDDQQQVNEINEGNNKHVSCFGPDLIVNDVTRTWPYYKIEYCNMGSTASTSNFTLLLTDINTGSNFRTNSLYPFSVPAPGTCAWTGGITCGLIGDTNCDANICVEGFVDDQLQVNEVDDTNNKRVACFT